MRYEKMRVVEPEGLEVGCDVGVVGEGCDTYQVVGISRDEDGTLKGIHLSCGWREPLSKIYLLRGLSHSVAFSDPTSWIRTAIGECDVCGKTFEDSCVFHRDPKEPKSMICQDCFRAAGRKGGTHIIL